MKSFSKPIIFNNPSDLQTKITYQKKIIKGYKKIKANLDPSNLNFHAVKRFEAKTWEFQGKLSTDFFGTTNDRHLNTLAKSLKKNRKMQRLKIICPNCGDISAVGIGNLSESIKSQTSLKRISIEFSGYNSSFTNQGMDYLGRAFKSLTSTQSVSLNFSLCRYIDEDGMDSVGKGLRTLLSVQEMNLSFISCQSITEGGLLKLGQSLKNKRNLSSLHADFSLCLQISDFGLSAFSKALKMPTCLQKLSLNFSVCQISDQGMRCLCRILQTLTSLKSFTCDVSGSHEITNKGMHDFGQSLQSLTSVENLSLKFNGCRKITTTGIHNLDQLTSLKSFSLQLNQSYQINDTAIQNFSSALAQITTLQRIDLQMDE